MLSLYENNFPKINIYNGKGLMLGGAIKSSKMVIQKKEIYQQFLLDRVSILGKST